MFKKTKFVAHFFNISTKTKFVDTVKLWIFVQLCREDDQSISDACGSENVLKCNYNIFTKNYQKIFCWHGNTYNFPLIECSEPFSVLSPQWKWKLSRQNIWALFFSKRKIPWLKPSIRDADSVQFSRKPTENKDLDMNGWTWMTSHFEEARTDLKII